MLLAHNQPFNHRHGREICIFTVEAVGLISGGLETERSPLHPFDMPALPRLNYSRYPTCKIHHRLWTYHLSSKGSIIVYQSHDDRRWIMAMGSWWTLIMKGKTDVGCIGVFICSSTYSLFLSSIPAIVTVFFCGLLISDIQLWVLFHEYSRSRSRRRVDHMPESSGRAQRGAYSLTHQYKKKGGKLS